MTIRAEQLVEYIIRPILKHMGMYSKAAEILLLGTAAQESNLLRFWHQVKGPALGLYQMEPATLDDLYKNFLSYHTVHSQMLSRFIVNTMDKHEQLVWNVGYATAACRLQYYRQPQALPPETDLTAIAVYWKKYWNTIAGRGTVKEFLVSYDHFVVGGS